MFKGFRSIESKLIIWVLAGTSLIFLLTYYFLYRQFQDYATESIQRESRLLTVTLAREIDARLQAVGGVTRQLAVAIAAVQPDAEALQSMLTHFVEDNPQILASAAAFDQGRFPGQDRFGLSIQEGDDGFRVERLHSGAQPYWRSPWYELTWRRRAPMWQEPAQSAGAGSRFTATYTAVIPSPNDQGDPAGVVSADIALDAVRDRVESVVAERKGFPIVLSGSGMILVHPNPDYVGAESFGGLIARGVNPEYQRIAERIATGKSDVAAVVDQAGETQWVAYAPLVESGWSLIYVIPEREFLADIEHLVRMIGLWAMMGILLLAVVVVILARRISRPLKQLAQVSHKVAEGDLEFELPDIDRGDEIGQLTEAFDRMRDSLKHYIVDLKDATAERQKLESELDIAAQIQRGMLKGRRFVREEPVHCEIAAMLEPAKAVGGDFYDYVELPENQLCLVVGDVSDKGVHAALFMARAITAVRSAVSFNFEPDQILKSVNAELCRNNDACMFATLFCAVQDMRFGYLRFASAGHDPPLLLNALGEVRYLEQESGPAVGLDDEAEYPAQKVRLKAGDILMLYTDGVTEAFDAQGELYGEQRLIQSLRSLTEANAERALKMVAEGVEVFSRGAPQSDDLTLLSMRFGTPRSSDLEEGMQRLWKQSSD